MSDPMHLPDDVEAFAKQVSMFTAQSRMDRDAIMFAAGQIAHECTTAGPCLDQSGVRLWRAATVAMTLVSVFLGSLIVLHPAPEPQVVIVERVLPNASGDAGISVDESPDVQHQAKAAVALSDELNGGSDWQSGNQLASAWKARQAMIADSGKVEFRPDEIAAANRRSSWGRDTRFVVDQPLTGVGFLPGRSRDAVSRSLEERL